MFYLCSMVTCIAWHSVATTWRVWLSCYILYNRIFFCFLVLYWFSHRLTPKFTATMKVNCRLSTGKYFFQLCDQFCRFLLYCYMWRTCIEQVWCLVEMKNYCSSTIPVKFWNEWMCNKLHCRVAAPLFRMNRYLFRKECVAPWVGEQCSLLAAISAYLLCSSLTDNLSESAALWTAQTRNDAGAIALLLRVWPQPTAAWGRWLKRRH